jgi:cytoskeleton protein RodZ
MPLDTGGVTNLHLAGDLDRDPDATESFVPTLDTGPDIGVALKTAREFRGLSLQDVADQTRIRRAYLAAIEEMRLDELPSRPFTIGYVRAYANALGLDGEAAVDRFKIDEPALDEPLREPVGVRRDGDPRLMTVIVGGLLVIGAIVLWNIAQRAMSERAPPPPTAPDVVAPPRGAGQAPVSLGAPLPAPVESTVPPEYKTPGLETATADGSVGSAAGTKATKDQASAAAAADLPATFTPQGKVYGAAAEASQVTLQARRATSLVVRGPNGTVYFARQLAAGEAYRASTQPGLVVDVVEADAVQAFAGGQSKGLLPVGANPVAKLAGATAAPGAKAATPPAQ